MILTINLCLHLTLLMTSPSYHILRVPDEPWISNYSGNISWEREKAYMDNFAIQLTRDLNIIGYILIYSGSNSCRGQAQQRAMKIKRYMMKVRGVPWDRVMWKDAGRYRGDGMTIFHLGIPREKLATVDFAYEPAPEGKIIKDCEPLRRRRRVKD